MAKVILEPIGRPRNQFLSEQIWSRQLGKLSELNRELQSKRAKVQDGWGESYRGRVHAKGKLTSWERVDRLKDADSPVLPVGTLVNYGRRFEDRGSPGAGVITAFVRVCGLWVVVIANDNTVASGSWWPETPEKIQRAQEIALRMRLPVVYLVD